MAREILHIRVPGIIFATLLVAFFVTAVFNQPALAADVAPVNELTEVAEARDLSEEALNKRGLEYLLREEFGKAVDDFTAAIKLNRRGAPARVNRGFAYYGVGNYKKAVRDFSKALKLKPSASQAAAALNGRSLSYFKLGKSSKAIVDLDEALGIDPWFEDALYNRASVYYENGKYTQAIGDYSKLIQMNSTDILAITGRARSLRDAGEYNRALTDYTRAMRLSPEEATLFHERGGTFHQKGLFDRALSDYKRALELGMKNASLFYDLGLTLSKKGDYTRAVMALTRSIKLQTPPEPKAEPGKNKPGSKEWAANITALYKLKSAYFQRGVAFKETRIFNAAVKDFTKVLELDPKDSDALSNRGYLLLVELEQTEKGCADLSAACELGKCGNFNIAKENALCE